jgi:hypothetical protein
MITLLAAAALAAAVQPSSDAAPVAQAAPSGHYEWRPVPQFGPRSIGPAMRRVWVPDRQKPACDCAMMATDPATCMQGSPGDR